MKISIKTIDRLIIGDHAIIKGYHGEYLKNKSKIEAMKWYHQFSHDLAVHSIAEEMVLYPIIRNKFTKGQEIYHRNLEEHQRIKEHLIELDKTDPFNPVFDSKYKQLIDDLYEHIEHEEKEELVELCERLDEEARLEAGRVFDRRKWIAPTRPHMTTYEYPMLLSLSGLLMKPIDEFRDLFREFPKQEEVNPIRQQVIDNMNDNSQV